MTREWKPGDVANIPGIGPAVRTHHGSWSSAYHASTTHYIGAEPLVVIDPESLDDVNRVRDACWRGGTVEHWQEFLRSLAAPPKPEEPTGLGAVVVDADQRIWVRWSLAHATPWTLAAGDSYADRDWTDLDAVKILNGGYALPDEPMADWERDLLRGQS